MQVAADVQALAVAIQHGDRRAVARLITAAEAGAPEITPVLAELYKRGGHARTIGVTGPPGAGKSTLIDQLIDRYRAAGKSVAVIAVDPSSPMTGGAVLGDRVRLGRHAGDSGVYVRSMATRGVLGGLARATGDALTVLDAAGYDVIVVETVGVGQSEVDIVSHAEAILVLQTAMAGDEVQAVKGGVLEVADILVVNKMSAPGSERMARILREAAHERPPRSDDWTVSVLETEAASGRGVEALMDEIERLLACAEQPAVREARLKRQLGAKIYGLCEARLRRVAFDHPFSGADEPSWRALLERTADPYAWAERLVGRDRA